MAQTVSLTPDVVHFEIVRGDTFSVPITMEDETGAPIDLTGAAIKMQVRTDPESPDVIVDISDASGIAVTPLSGLLVPTFAAPSKARRYSYDIEVTHASGVVETILLGQLIVISDSTR